MPESKLHQLPAPLLKHESIPIATKAKLIDSIFLTTLTYQCQTWPLTQGLKNKLVACKIRCLRKVVNKTRRDKIRNEVIRAQVGATPVLHVENQQIKWFGHLMRMPTDQPAHQAYNSRYSGKRPRGRPRRRWSDSVADTLKGHNKSLCEASHLAIERRLHLTATPDGPKKSWLQPGQTGIISCFAHNPTSEGSLAAGSYTRHIGFYDLRCEGVTCVIEGQRGGITHLMFTPDGNMLLSGARKDNEILCWDMRNLGTVCFSALRDVKTNQRMYFDVTSYRCIIIHSDELFEDFWVDVFRWCKWNGNREGGILSLEEFVSVAKPALL
ncbi:telomerase Cajal body protein [Elysia marginata]|uniref:WD repeat-containing protein 79 n=1 Tax=Elysia marginata TaxID=1093978 RepID=A0AAV4HTK2_9GAST|nr:telomerase Cajal body protein [Elysia marginata]